MRGRKHRDVEGYNGAEQNDSNDDGGHGQPLGPGCTGPPSLRVARFEMALGLRRSKIMTSTDNACQKKRKIEILLCRTFQFF